MRYCAVDSEEYITESIIYDCYNPHRQELNLEKVNDKYVEPVLCRRSWRKLKSLNLKGRSIGDHLLQEIMDLKLPNIQVLYLDKTKMGDIEADLIWKKQQWTKLHTLSLQSNNISANGIRNMPNCHKTNILKYLNISKNNLSSKGAKILSKSKMQNLETIIINGCNIGNIGLKHIAKSNWPKLKSLKIQNNRIKLDGYGELTSWGLKCVLKLYLGQNRDIVYIMHTLLTDMPISCNVQFQQFYKYIPNMMIFKQIWNQRFVIQ